VFVGIVSRTETSRVLLLAFLQVNYFLFELLDLVFILFNDLLTEMRSLGQFFLHLPVVSQVSGQS
jgi:hypothetical protein